MNVSENMLFEIQSIKISDYDFLNFTFDNFFRIFQFNQTQNKENSNFKNVQEF